MITLILEGRPASKKNNRLNLRKGGRVIDIPSNAYRAYRKECLAQIKAQVFLQQVQLPIEPWYKIKVIARYRTLVRLDADNILSTILDILQDAEVITDDKFVGDIDVVMELNTRDRDQVVISIDTVGQKEFVR